MAEDASTGSRVPAGPNPRESPEDVTRRLLKAASAVFGRVGYEQGSLREIAEIAGFTTGAISSRWRTKKALFAAVVEYNYAPVQFDLLRSAGLSPLETMAAIASSVLNRDPERDAVRSVRVMACSTAGNDSELRPVVAQAIARERDDLASLMAGAQAAGDLDPALDPGVLAFYGQAVTLGVELVRRALEGEQTLPTDEEWRTFMTRLFENLRADSSTPADD